MNDKDIDLYKVKKTDHPLNIDVEVPGSKSITNRALLMAAMADGKSVIRGVLFSDDSKYFLQSLEKLGFDMNIDYKNKTVTIEGKGGEIPEKETEIYVGSAGTAARFLTAFLGMSDGKYKVDSSEQMKKRPMRELLEVLEALGAKIEYKEKEYHFPFVIEGIGKNSSVEKSPFVKLNIDRSSQFLSALLMTAPLRFDEFCIELTGKRNARSYVEMTEQMMKQFSHPGVKRINDNTYQVERYIYIPKDYQVEPDVSAACYFYAMAAVTGGSAVVRHMVKDSLQGDMKFIEVLEKMNCTILWTDKNELLLKGPEKGELKGFDLSFSDFSDQALTAAAIAPYANSPVRISGIAHIRGQESDRIKVMSTELEKMGIRCEETDDSITIYPGEIMPAQIETYDDHRVAMSFAVTGLMSEGIVIKNPGCCRKTFPEYFEVFDDICTD